MGSHLLEEGTLSNGLLTVNAVSQAVLWLVCSGAFVAARTFAGSRPTKSGVASGCGEGEIVSSSPPRSIA